MSDKFINGSQWVRFDCHLHTNSDKEFKYNEDENYYISSYVNKLKEEDISVGVITNHNKFNLEEFKAIKKTANKKDIFIMPGVELSVNDGANGIHTLIVFDEKEWLENENNYIQQFIDETFVTQSPNNYQNENGRSNDNLITTIEKLNKYHRGYFIILAHIEDKSGFFKALDGGRIIEFGKNKLFRNNVIAFQKVTKDDLTDWNKWLNNTLPAFVEGSDPKKIEEIGKGKKSYIKIGAYNFEAVKFALQDKKYRVNKELPKTENSYIKSISFNGGKLDGQTIELSSSMNNFVGVRGSGKSSVIEAVRYGLDLEFSDKNADYKYKNNLIEKLLGSAGKITIKAFDDRNNEYSIERVYGHSVEVKKDEEIMNLDIFSFLNKPLYFGQKDLSSYKDGYENDLINKFIGDKTKDIKSKIDMKKQEIKSLLENIKKYDNLNDKKEEVKKKIEELKLKIDEFKKHNIEDKLKKQIEFNKDDSNFTNIIKDLQEFRNDANSFLKTYEENNFFENLKKYKSKENQDIFNRLYTIIDTSKDTFLNISTQLNSLTSSFKDINSLHSSFKDKYKKFNDTFLEVQRNINLPDNLRADDFINYTKILNSQELMLKEIEKLSHIKNNLTINLTKLISELNNLYLEEFRLIENGINSINQNKSSIELKAEFKGDKDSFDIYLRNIFSGSGLTKADYEKLTQYKDCIEIYNDFDNISFGGNKLLIFKEKFINSLSSLLTFQVSNKIEILYNGELLVNHSLGQRASALIIFILTQRDNDIIIIDQPEDDLDNQTIYKEVIEELLKLKNKTQFIFATHNANIPVLGDCEQIVVCNYEENKINIQIGSIDNHDIQDNIINIMEGGEKAFNKRRDIYNLWKH
jgi:predicted ATPase